FFLVAGELALVEKGLLAGDGRDRDRGEAGGGDCLQRPRHQLGFEQRERTFEAISAAARHLRHAAELGPVVLLDKGNMVERLEVELAWLADGADDGIEAL